MLKTNRNIQNSKNPKSTFLGTRMRAHPNCMHTHTSSMRTHAYTPRNTISEQQTKYQFNKP